MSPPTVAATVKSLREKLAQLEAGPAVVGDWHRLEAAAGRALITAQNEVATLQRDMLEMVKLDPPKREWYVAQGGLHLLRGLMEELRMFRLCAQSRLFEIEAEDNQANFRAAQ